jgi:hypothetical protein
VSTRCPTSSRRRRARGLTLHHRSATATATATAAIAAAVLLRQRCGRRCRTLQLHECSACRANGWCWHWSRRRVRLRASCVLQAPRGNLSAGSVLQHIWASLQSAEGVIGVRAQLAGDARMALVTHAALSGRWQFTARCSCCAPQLQAEGVRKELRHGAGSLERTGRLRLHAFVLVHADGLQYASFVGLIAQRAGGFAQLHRTQIAQPTTRGRCAGIAAHMHTRIALHARHKCSAN